MKVVVYNFVQPSDVGKQGGGVAIYHRNLVSALIKAGHDVVSLSSGDRYSVLGGKPFLKTSRPLPGDRYVEGVIYNSPVLAPSHTSFYRLNTFLESTELDAICGDLKSSLGDIDVFHFQNIEGLTASFFVSLKRIFPKARLIYSAHNYNLVCPQVSLWFRETKHCEDNRGGRACVNCIGGWGPNPNEVNIRRMDSLVASFGLKRHGRLSRFVEIGVRAPFRLKRWLLARSLRSPPPPPRRTTQPRVIIDDALALPYLMYKARNIELATKTFDQILAVSKRTKQILVKNGVPEHRIEVSYIGTAHQAMFKSARKVHRIEDRLHIAYLGYMRSDKGFFFFLECLHLIPESLSSRMCVTIAAPFNGGWAAEQLKSMAQKFQSIILYNGYSHDTLNEILKPVNLGIIPVLWEDNLPQVAIEIVSRGIPILTADRGGAQEIGSNPNFVFQSGSKSNFVYMLAKIQSGEVSLGSFWQGETKIVSMESHLDDLLTFYRRPSVRQSGREPRKVLVSVR